MKADCPPLREISIRTTILFIVIGAETFYAAKGCLGANRDSKGRIIERSRRVEYACLQDFGLGEEQFIPILIENGLYNLTELAIMAHELLSRIRDLILQIRELVFLVHELVFQIRHLALEGYDCDLHSFNPVQCEPHLPLEPGPQLHTLQLHGIPTDLRLFHLQLQSVRIFQNRLISSRWVLLDGLARAGEQGLGPGAACRKQSTHITARGTRNREYSFQRTEAGLYSTFFPSSLSLSLYTYIYIHILFSAPDSLASSSRYMVFISAPGSEAGGLHLLLALSYTYWENP